MELQNEILSFGLPVSVPCESVGLEVSAVHPDDASGSRSHEEMRDSGSLRERGRQGPQALVYDLKPAVGALGVGDDRSPGAPFGRSVPGGAAPAPAPAFWEGPQGRGCVPTLGQAFVRGFPSGVWNPVLEGNPPFVYFGNHLLGRGEVA